MHTKHTLKSPDRRGEILELTLEFTKFLFSLNSSVDFFHGRSIFNVIYQHIKFSLKLKRKYNICGFVK